MLCRFHFDYCCSIGIFFSIPLVLVNNHVLETGLIEAKKERCSKVVRSDLGRGKRIKRVYILIVSLIRPLWGCLNRLRWEEVLRREERPYSLFKLTSSTCFFFFTFKTIHPGVSLTARWTYQTEVRFRNGKDGGFICILCQTCNPLDSSEWRTCHINRNNVSHPFRWFANAIRGRLRHDTSVSVCIWRDK